MIATAYEIASIEKAKLDDLQEGVYLILLNPHQVPPHLLMSVGGKVFSISTKGVELDKPIEVYWKLIHKYNFTALYVQLELPEFFTLDQLQERIRTITSGFPNVSVSGVSCLMPLKSFYQETYQVENNQIQLVFDLLDEMKRNKHAKQFLHTNLEKEIKEGKFLMERYSVFEVNEAIHKSQKRRR